MSLVQMPDTGSWIPDDRIAPGLIRAGIPVFSECGQSRVYTLVKEEQRRFGMGYKTGWLPGRILHKGYYDPVPEGIRVLTKKGLAAFSYYSFFYHEEHTRSG